MKFFRVSLGVMAMILIGASLAGYGALRYSASPLRLLAAAGEGISDATDTASGASSTVIDALQQLQSQQQDLASEVADMQAHWESAHLKATFTRVLRRGDSGNDVAELQSLLIQASLITASSTTGYYGRSTATAIADLQSQMGLKPTGIFDRATRDGFLDLLASEAASSAAPGNEPLDLSTVPDPQQSIQSLQSQVSQLSAELSDTQSALSDLANQVSGLASQVSDLQTNESAVPATPPSGNTAFQSLAIANIQVSGISKTGATIAWTTNNPSTGEVDYSQNPSFPVSQTLTINNSGLATAHSITLSRLSSGVTYYYHVISKDADGTTANSSNLVFTTLH